MNAQTKGGISIGSISLAVVGLLLVAVGSVLFISYLPIAGYGILALVWGLALLLGAFSRFIGPRT